MQQLLARLYRCQGAGLDALQALLPEFFMKVRPNSSIASRTDLGGGICSAATSKSQGVWRVCAVYASGVAGTLH